VTVQSIINRPLKTTVSHFAKVFDKTRIQVYRQTDNIPFASGVARIWRWGAQGVWGTEVPHRGPAAEPLVGGSGGHSLPKAHSSY